MKPTIYDIARLAEVSTATVSKVFNGRGSISEETKNRVMRISRELNYQPSVVASALAGKKTYTLGMLVPDLINPFFAEMTRHVEDRAHELGFNLVICNTDNHADKESDYIRLLRQKRVDGIIIATGVGSETLLHDLTRETIPLALIAREMSVLTASTVLVDDFSGGYAATAYLLGLGHRRIAIITENRSLVSSKERIRGYRSALAEAGLAEDEDLIKESDFSLEGGGRVASELLAGATPPTAIFACNDLLAIGAIQAAKQMGVDVPAELSVVGFDNTILAAISDPPLTTVAQPIQEMGRQVVDVIIDKIHNPAAPEQRVMLLPNLLIRQSADHPK